jgi:hypothetical protein
MATKTTSTTGIGVRGGTLQLGGLATQPVPFEHPTHFKDWKQQSNSIICLSVDNEDKLIKYYDKLSKLTTCSIFFEPDVDQYTSICVCGTPEVRKMLSHLPLSLKKEVVND